MGPHPGKRGPGAHRTLYAPSVIVRAQTGRHGMGAHGVRAVSTLLALTAAATLTAALPAAAAPAGVHITIVHTNDLHGYVENCPAIAAVAKEARAHNPN